MYRAAPWLVVRDPELDLGSHRLEDKPRIVHEILNIFLLVQQAAVAIVQALRKIPVKERNHRLDVVREEFVYEVNVVLQTFLVDWVIAATEWDHAGPGDTEPVRLCSKRLQQRNVGFVLMVRVASSHPARAVRDLSWDAAERVPDRVASTIHVHGAFDLVATAEISTAQARPDVPLAYLAVAKPQRKSFGSLASVMVV